MKFHLIVLRKDKGLDPEHASMGGKDFYPRHYYLTIPLPQQPEILLLRCRRLPISFTAHLFPSSLCQTAYRGHAQLRGCFATLTLKCQGRPHSGCYPSRIQHLPSHSFTPSRQAGQGSIDWQAGWKMPESTSPCCGHFQSKAGCICSLLI